MRRTAIVVGSHFVERSKTTNDHLKPKRNMSERNKAAGEFARQINHSQNQAQYRSNSLKKQIGFIILLSLMLSGCAVAPPTQTGPIMIPGSMFSLKDGTEFVFAIEYRFNNGIMTARNLTTGEDFYGNYTAIFADGEVSKGTYRNAWGGHAGSVTTTTTATRGTGKGILRGDKGTVISITMDIKPTYNRSIYPSGFGDGTDNNGTRYQLQFGAGGTSVSGTPPSDAQKSVSAPGIPAGVYQATRNYGNGDKYIGEFLNGQFHGKGIYTYANGDKYEGEFINGKFSGKGTFTCSNGKQFTGIIDNKVTLESTIRCN
ncbi:MAG TPA: hypothetical protein VLH56_00225 [Dissulfurispiraceae bacterium]|nr:hypothetical protein [Dissulfurispiraceae bacterium]